ncbi:MAG: cupredoxin domain-containing protein, partial [Bdellovibrionales bacterium]|nr:cupredoxin domain-containing protein [Bdellovibrionales bacterium]
NPDRRLKNKNGETAFDLAKHWQKDAVVDLVRIPDTTVMVKGNDDGTCSPLEIKLSKGQVVELILTATEKMFKLESDDLNLDLMADRNSSVSQIISPDGEGEFKFTCGLHGSSNPSVGKIIIK